MLLLQVRALKQQNNALADEASSAKFKLVDAQQEQLKLKGQIVEVRRASRTVHLSLLKEQLVLYNQHKLPSQCWTRRPCLQSPPYTHSTRAS